MKSFGPCATFCGQADHARQHARRLHDGRARIAAEGVAALQLDGEIQALVEDARERVRGIEPDGREHRHHLAEEVVADPLLLRRRPFARGAGSGCPPSRAPGSTSSLSSRYWRSTMPWARAATWRKTSSGREAVGPGVAAAPSLICSFTPESADLEELVEVGRDDAQELQPLEQRHGAVLGLREHAAVEFERLQLAIEEMLGSVALHARGLGLGLPGHDGSGCS